MKLHRPALSVESLTALTIAYLLVSANGPFWRAALSGRDLAEGSTWAFAAALSVLVGALHFVGISLLTTRWTVRPLLAVLCVVASLASFYMDRYAIYLDRAMLRNVLATDYHESRELLSWAMGGHVAAFGVLPALALWWPRLVQRGAWKALGLRAAWMVSASVLAVVAILPVFGDFASLMRNHKEARYLITPGNALVALAGNAWGRSPRSAAALAPVAPDARLSSAWKQRQRPTLFVLVVGETARAQNFSLNGYERATNPELWRKREVVNFP